MQGKEACARKGDRRGAHAALQWDVANGGVLRAKSALP